MKSQSSWVFGPVSGRELPAVRPLPLRSGPREEKQKLPKSRALSVRKMTAPPRSLVSVSSVDGIVSYRTGAWTWKRAIGCVKVTRCFVMGYKSKWNIKIKYSKNHSATFGIYIAIFLGRNLNLAFSTKCPADTTGQNTEKIKKEQKRQPTILTGSGRWGDQVTSHRTPRQDLTFRLRFSTSTTTTKCEMKQKR